MKKQKFTSQIVTEFSKKTYQKKGQLIVVGIENKKMLYLQVINFSFKN